MWSICMCSGGWDGVCLGSLITVLALQVTVHQGDSTSVYLVHVSQKNPQNTSTSFTRTLYLAWHRKIIQFTKESNYEVR